MIDVVFFGQYGRSPVVSIYAEYCGVGKVQFYLYFAVFKFEEIKHVCLK